MAVVVPTLERAVVLVIKVSKERRVLIIFLCFFNADARYAKSRTTLAYGSIQWIERSAAWIASKLLINLIFLCTSTGSPNETPPGKGREIDLQLPCWLQLTLLG